MTTSPEIADLFPDDRLATTERLLEAQIAVGAALSRHAVEPVGLDPATADLIVRLAQAPGLGLRGVDIANQLLINPARVSRLIDRAEAAGLVERRVDPDDRRAQRVELTSAGEAKARVFAPLMLGVLDEAVFSTFTQAELDALQGLLGRLRDAARLTAESESPAAAPG
jgi:DNA-binding MarR family transcriptional regulator